MADLFDKRLVIVTGKGGVGKTTVALALGMAAARAGKRTIVCEVASQERASRAFGHEAIGFSETQLDERLYGISIDPDESMREYVLLQLRVRAARDLLFRSRVFTYLTAATPGLRELVTIGKIWELAQLDRKVKHGRKYDLVIVDAPATGHGVAFLQTPKTFRDLARVGPIASQAGRMHTFLTDHRLSCAVLVCLPEEMPVNETASLEHDLRAMGMAVPQIWMNALVPDRFDDAEAGKIAAAMDGTPSAAMSAALFEHRRCATQAEQLARLETATVAPVATLPFVFAPTLGLDELGVLADQLGGDRADQGSQATPGAGR